MRRKAQESLKNWSTNPKSKPLLVRGARQVGKTYLIEEFGKTYFKENFLQFNFEARPELKKIFSGGLEPNEIIPQLELITDKNIADNKTLIFFDEIQACPEALISLRYFYEQRPKLKVIAAGSLLEFALSKVSFPVGRVEILNLYPMTFEEFLLAKNKNKLRELILNKPQLLKETEHNLLLKEYKTFMLIGGLPEPVKIFLETNSALNSLKAQKNLVTMYEADFNKYVGRADILCLKQVFRNISQKITNQIKYSLLSPDYSIPTIKNAIHLLESAQIISRVPNTNPHRLPLGASASAKIFKSIMLDLSLIHSLSNLDPQSELNSDNLLDSYRGALAEQVVGQEILSQTDSGLYTWYREAKGSTAEVDFVISKNGKVYPIEVKSGAVGRLKSLHQFRKDYKLTDKAFAISTSPFSIHKSEGITVLPIYYSSNLVEWL